MNAQQLRNSILQMAIQGKLVPQDPNDEPASVLLERIRQQKEQLVKEGKLKKKDLVTTPVAEEEMPFELPNGWEWVRLGYLIDLLSGQDLTPNRYSAEEKGIPYITGASCFINGQLVLNRWTTSPTSVSHYGDLLITCKGTVGTMAYNKIGDIHIARQIMAISTKWLYLPYIKYFLLFIVPELEKQAHSIIPGISRDVVLNSVFPLPPLSEQRRIVAKLEELLPLVEQYGKAQDSLDALNADLPRRLRQSILQQFYGNVTENNCSLASCCEIIMGQSPSGETYNSNGNGIEFHQGKTYFGDMFLRSSKIYTSIPTKVVEGHSIVISVRAPVGTANITTNKICIGRGLAAIIPHENADLLYIYYALESPMCRLYLDEHATGTTFKAISGDILKKYIIPLPPLAEQRRIVAKIEELFATIDKLK